MRTAHAHTRASPAHSTHTADTRAETHTILVIIVVVKAAEMMAPMAVPAKRMAAAPKRMPSAPAERPSREPTPHATHAAHLEHPEQVVHVNVCKKGHEC